MEISLLRPEYWLHEHHAEPGDTIDAVEFGRLGVVGAARVKSVSPCPEVRAGPGRTVTGIYRHYASRLLDLRTDNGEELGTTPDHHFWSETRHTFVQAGDLEPGETLQLLDGTTRVTSITPRDKGAIVYTLEVQVEHVFHVANSGILVHNCNPGLKVADDAVEAAKKTPTVKPPRSVEELADAIRNRYPEKRINVEEVRNALNGNGIEIDIELDNAIIEVKAGRSATGAIDQMLRRQQFDLNPTGKPIILYSTNPKGWTHAGRRAIERLGGIAADGSTINELLDILN